MSWKGLPDLLRLPERMSECFFNLNLFCLSSRVERGQEKRRWLDRPVTIKHCGIACVGMHRFFIQWSHSRLKLNVLILFWLFFPYNFYYTDINFSKMYWTPLNPFQVSQFQNPGKFAYSSGNTKSSMPILEFIIPCIIYTTRLREIILLKWQSTKLG